MQAAPDNNPDPDIDPAVSLSQSAAGQSHATAAKLCIVGKTPDVRDHLIKRQAVALQLVASILDQHSLQASLTALVGELHHKIRCDRVAFGLMNSGTLQVKAISQQANLDPQSGEVRLLQEAMQEACDQDAVITYPGSNADLHRVSAHRTLHGNTAHRHLCSVPVCYQGETIGVLLFEKTSEQTWTVALLAIMRQLAQLSAPLIALRRDTEQSLPELLKLHAQRSLAKLLGPHYLRVKSATLATALVLLIAVFLPVTHRITAEAELAPIERRVITAPMVGYIDSVLVGTGDLVAAGQTLLRLDTSDLDLQKVRWQNRILGIQAEFRSAMAEHDRKDMAIAQAQLEQARAQVALVQQQIDRAELRAPTDGVVVSGDLSQSTGAPVERGTQLLELAPTDGYKVHLLVDEVDISYVAIDQTGQLALTADPGNPLAFQIVAIHPIANSNDGKNRFQVEAKFDQNGRTLRPGQTGVGRLNVGQASLLWTWTHRFTQWFRQRWWEWSS